MISTSRSVRAKGPGVLRLKRCLRVAAGIVSLYPTLGPAVVLWPRRRCGHGLLVKQPRLCMREKRLPPFGDLPFDLLDRGVVKPVIHQVFPLANAADAHRLMESGDHIGKIVLAART